MPDDEGDIPMSRSLDIFIKDFENKTIMNSFTSEKMPPSQRQNAYADVQNNEPSVVLI